MTQRHMTDHTTTDDDPNDALNQIPQEEEEEPILSHEFLQEYGNTDEVIAPPKQKKAKSSSTAAVELTADEIKEATQQKKAHQKKLHTLQVRQELKKKRERLYAQLQQHSIVVETTTTTTAATARSSGTSPHPTMIQSLLIKSSQLNTKFTKRQRRQRAYQKEQMQLPLTNDEQELLFYDNNNSNNPTTGSTTEMTTTELMVGVDEYDDDEKPPAAASLDHAPERRDPSRITTPDMPASSTTKTPSSSFLASQMMASLVALQQRPPTVHDRDPVPNTTTQTIDDGIDINNNKNDDDDNELRSEPVAKHKTTLASATASTTRAPAKYVPTEPLVLQTTPSYATTTTATKTQRCMSTIAKRRKDVHDRPPDIEQWRLELPVVQMEYEIMELISSHDISIICSETGSGKSTQIPQFLYEAGYSRTVHDDDSSGGGGGGLIGITQPRRVAAISSAKRVCYEMGHGNGQSITPANLVSYQTRYESAGYSHATTEIQFMTDGILLQEIRNDLLLRKYSVIILDEAHERNLNTDILIGLLSIAIPLRNHHARQHANNNNNAAVLRPLKLIIMSATLRVEDFTTNPKLFHHPQYVPGVITIPGRTFPVTVHHNKVTELNNYGTCLLSKEDLSLGRERK